MEYRIPVIGGFLLGTMLYEESKNRKLLKGGNLALGVVVAQQNTGKRKAMSEITYEFKNSAGEKYRRNLQDHTNSYFSGMTVPIFYDPNDAARSVALHSTHLRVVELVSSSLRGS